MNPALKLTSTKTIPAHFAQTQLGLQEITHPDSARLLQMLQQLIKKDQLSILTKEVVQGIGPYLMEQQSAKVFGSWLQESILLKRDTSKQQIIETVHKLEMNPLLN